MSSLDHWLNARLFTHKNQLLYRNPPAIQSAQDRLVTIQGKPFVNFSSNNYLGLANHPAVVEALCQGAKTRGAGSGASHLVSGHSDAHERLEKALAIHTGRECARLFSTGYMANLAAICALMTQGDQIFLDRFCHASVLDAAQLSGARFRRFPHLNLTILEEFLHKSSTKQRLIVTDSVFSMEGDLAPLPELASVAQRHKAWLMVDDAHGFGVLGKRGGGALEHFALGQEQAPILVGTLGKALAVSGAFVAGSKPLIEALTQFARPYMYTTALPPALALACLKSLELLGENWRRRRLCQLRRRFRAAAQKMGYQLLRAPTPIQPIVLGDSARALKVSALLYKQGLLIPAIRPPTVPKNTARLRISLCANHSDEDLDLLCHALASVPAKDRNLAH